MAWRKLPLPILIHRSEDEAALPDQVGARLIDAYIDKFRVYRKRPALELFVDLATGFPIDGLYWWDAQQLVIAASQGRIFHITTATGDVTEVTGTDKLNVGTIVITADNADRAFMANNSRILVDDNVGAPAFLADPDAPQNATHVAFLNQRIIANEFGTQQILFSNLTTIPLGTGWQPLDVFSAESKPDVVQALFTNFRELFVFGKESMETFFDDGITPFARIDTGFNEHGLNAIYSAARTSGTFIWFNQERRVVVLRGRAPVVVSNPFDDVFRDFTPVTDAEAFFLPIGTRGFYVVNFPTARKTIVYDITTDKWHEWGKFNSGNNEHDEFIGRVHTFAVGFNFHLVGDRNTGKIYKIRQGVFQDDGATIKIQLRTGHISYGTLLKKQSNAVIFRFKRGLGASSPIGDEPEIMLRWRDNNGPFKTEVKLSLGKIGENEFIARRNRMGIYRTRQYEISHTANTDFVLVDAEEDIVPLRC